MPRKIFLIALPLLFLTATFEHCYYILSLYNGGLILPVLTTTLLVLAIDSSIYFSMQFINILPARIILAMSGTISVVLNVKFMLDWKPPGIFGSVIAIVVGLIIPSMLGLFGWLEKEIRESVSSINENGHLRTLIDFHLLKYPRKSNRELADIIGCSHTTVRKYRQTNHKENV